MTSLNRLYLLAKDRVLETSELHPGNSYYGHAELFKKRLGLRSSYPLKVILEHGPTITEYVWDAELRLGLPYYFCSNKYYANVVINKSKGSINAVPIGPFVSYIDEYDVLRNYVGSKKVLLVFPWHSTHHYTLIHDPVESAKNILKFAKTFDAVVICLYWKDILLGRAEAYAAQGFECVSAGHMYDCNFLHRLLRIISKATMVISGYPGTDVLYSALMGKPVFIRTQEGQLACSSELYKNMMDTIQSHKGLQNLMCKLFAEPEDELTPRQKDFVAMALGIEYRKNDQQLLDILVEAENCYCRQRGKSPISLPFI